MERKELLGAVLDEVQHQVTLFKPERYAYLALAGLAALCLVTATVLLIMHSAVNAELAIGIVGGAGLIAVASARTGAFFHTTFTTLDDLVRRYSKVSDADFVSALEKLKKTSHLSLSLLAVGAVFVLGSVVFTFARVRPFETQFAQKVMEVVKLQADVLTKNKTAVQARQDYDALKARVEQTYAVHVMPDHSLVEAKALAEPLPHKKSEPATYKFSVLLRSTPDELAAIKQVRYDFRDPKVSAEPIAVAQADNGFAASYTGDACEPNVGIDVELKSGAKHAFDADLCKSLGPPWQAPASQAAPAK